MSQPPNRWGHGPKPGGFVDRHFYLRGSFSSIKTALTIVQGLCIVFIAVDLAIFATLAWVIFR